MSRAVILTSKPEAARVLRRVGFPEELVEDILRPLPDPLDFKRALLLRGLTIEILIDRMGGRP